MTKEDDQTPAGPEPEGIEPIQYQHVVEFLKTWNSLPPLVRASAAAHVALERENALMHITRDIVMEQHEMPRRARVTTQFMRAAEAFRKLAVGLANQADKEAEETGIDLDTRYVGQDDPFKEYTDRKAPITKGMIWQPAGEVSVEARVVAEHEVMYAAQQDIIDEQNKKFGEDLAKAREEAKDDA